MFYALLILQFNRYCILSRYFSTTIVKKFVLNVADVLTYVLVRRLVLTVFEHLIDTVIPLHPLILPLHLLHHLIDLLTAC